MNVAWAHNAGLALFSIWLKTPHERRDSVRDAWLALGDRLATDPLRAGVPFDGPWRTARVGPIVAFYRIDESGVFVRHTAKVVG